MIVYGAAVAWLFPIALSRMILANCHDFNLLEKSGNIPSSSSHGIDHKL